MTTRMNFAYCKVDFEKLVYSTVGNFEENHPSSKYVQHTKIGFITGKNSFYKKPAEIYWRVVLWRVFNMAGKNMAFFSKSAKLSPPF